VRSPSTSQCNTVLEDAVAREEPMKRIMLFCLVLIFAVAPVLAAHGQTSDEASTPQTERSSSAGLMLVDGLIVRPIGIVAIAVGLVGTVITLPFSVPSGNVNAVGQKLIGEPFAYTFTRPLGVFPGASSMD